MLCISVCHHPREKGEGQSSSVNAPSLHSTALLKPSAQLGRDTKTMCQPLGQGTTTKQTAVVENGHKEVVVSYQEAGRLMGKGVTNTMEKFYGERY